MIKLDKPSTVPAESSSRNPSVFDSLVDKVRHLARNAGEAPADGPLKNFKVLAADHKPAPGKPATEKLSDEQAKQYTDITALPEPLDFSKLKIVSEDSTAGVIYFEHEGNQYKISQSAAAEAQGGYNITDNLRFGHAVAERPGQGPDHGTQLYDFLHTVNAAQGTPAYKAIAESFSDPDKQLLRKDEAGIKFDAIESVDPAAEGVLEVTLKDGRVQVVAEGITPGAFETYTAIGKVKDTLAEGKAKGYEEINSLPTDFKADHLKVDSQDPETGVIFFEDAGHKYMMSGAANPADYNLLHGLAATEGTPAGELIKGALADPNQGLVREDGDAAKLTDIKKVESPADGVLKVTLNDDKVVTVSKDITPTSFAQYSEKGQTLAGVEKARGDGYTLAGPDDYLPSTEDIMSVGGAGDYGPGLIAFTYHKPGADEQKIVVSQESNPQMFDQISGYRDDIAAQTTDIDKLRGDHGLPPLKDVTVDGLATTEKGDDGNPLSVQDLTMKSLVDDYRAGMKDGSIGKDDPRARFIRALDAKNMADNGMSIIPEHGFGNFGNAQDAIGVTSRDVRENIFDVKAIDEQIATLLTDKSIQADLKSHHDAALGKVDGGQAKVDETRQKLLDSTSSENFINYIADLQKDGKTELAGEEIRSAYQGLADIDPARADQFLKDLQVDSYTLEIDKLMKDPSLISDDATAQATRDVALTTISVLKTTGVDIPRNGLNTYEKFVQEVLLKDKDSARDFGKAATELGDIWQKNGKITTEDISKVVDNSPMDATKKSAFREHLGTLNSAGILGSIGGTISGARAVYQLIKGDTLGATPQQRLAIAGDFIGFLGTGSHFAKLGGNIYDKLTGTEASQMLGLDKSLPDIWKPKTSDVPGIDGTTSALTPEQKAAAAEKLKDHLKREDIQSKIFDTIDNSMLDGDAGAKNAGKALNKGAGLFSDDNIDKVKDGIISGVEKRGINIKEPARWQRIAGSAIKIIGATADVVGSVLGITSGALTIRDGVREKDDIKIAQGALGVAGGVSGLVGSIAGVTGLFGTVGRVIGGLGPAGFLFSGALSLVGVILGSIKEHKLHKLSMQNWDQIKDFKDDGLLKPGGDDAYVWLQTYLSDWGQRDAPTNQSVFDFRGEEWAHHSTIKDKPYHPDYIGDGSNRRSEDFKYSTRDSEWIDDDHKVIWRTTDGYGTYHDVDKPLGS
ncbi:hypothetical protein [Pseudomonas gingeri]|uniref:hypothetical protein n=1 Tax=Pseudomonas gingeri TaxID=117681 RepID=UPI0015A2ACFA|nr:hypothetical protein [Pseudomonas gingeri]NWA02251.1 hypothetical protein [Pseudomonas gingeri]NWA17880.1 hypothetical protein [Pseudomonas gingeri]NWA56793.1 hypothetical protein [Pseudomonas gingeri]NWA97096.1 hypothetical protein [Pseudomonas gingeri]NWB03703.1 hypothetical protein [Pseudomonas gingeri]